MSDEEADAYYGYTYSEIKAALEDDIVCVIGNENKLEEEKEHFKELRSIF